MKKHTELPWLDGGENEFINQRRIDPCIGIVYGDKEQAIANAEFIIRACNSHHQMVEALVMIREVYIDPLDNGKVVLPPIEIIKKHINQIDAALLLAKGES